MYAVVGREGKQTCEMSRQQKRRVGQGSSPARMGVGGTGKKTEL